MQLMYVLLMVVASVLFGCGGEQTTDDIETATLAVLGGVEPDEETKKKWKKMSESDKGRFIGLAQPVVDKNCFQAELDFKTCVRNTDILKDKDWVTVQSSAPIHSQAFAEGVYLFLGNPVKPGGDYETNLKERLRVSEERKLQAETELKTLSKDWKILKEKILHLGFQKAEDARRVVLKAVITGDENMLFLITQKNDDTLMKKTILELLQDEPNGFNKLKASSELRELFTDLKFDQMKDTKIREETRDKVFLALRKMCAVLKADQILN
jgi:hypothetical protein